MASELSKKIIDARVHNLLELCNQASKIKYDDEKSVRDFYFYCLHERNTGNYYSLDCFKKWFPDMFTKMQGILNKRTLIKRDIELMQSIGKRRVVFGSLTFDDVLDKKTERNKRVMAQRYLDKYMPIYEIVEEYGEEKGRYHIHFIGVMSDSKTYIEFHSGWNSFSFIQPLKSVKKTSKYLCDYVVKQVPRIRRNKRLCACIKYNDLINKCHDSNKIKEYELEIQKCLIDLDSELPF